MSREFFAFVAVGVAVLALTSAPAGADEPHVSGSAHPVVVRGNTWYPAFGPGDGKAEVVVRYGRADDRQLVGDFDGDGVDTPGVVRGNQWLLRNVNRSGYADVSFRYGSSQWGRDPQWTAVVGDWDGNGTDTPGWVHVDGSRSRWYLVNEAGDPFADQILEIHGGQPVVGDFDGDGRDAIGVKDGSRWFVDNGPDGHAEMQFSFGHGGGRDRADIALAGDWNGDGADDPTIARQPSNFWYARYSPTTGVHELTFRYGSGHDRDEHFVYDGLFIERLDPHGRVAPTCGRQDGDIVTVRFGSDGTPQPRCVEIRGHQWVRFVSPHDGPYVDLSIAGFQTRLSPSTDKLFARDFSDYLHTGGSHTVQAGGAGNVELYFPEGP